MQTTRSQLHKGMTAYGSDAEKIGDIAEVQNDYFIIEKGFIFTEDLYIPMSLVASSHETDGVRLSITKSEVENGDWSNPPLTDRASAGTTDYATQPADLESDTLERREERLVVDKQTEKAGEVRVGKHVVEEEQSVDVPVTREEVTLERRAVDRPATGTTSSEDRIDVPVYEERVEAGKDARVVEELEVDKRATKGTERVTGTVRKEEFDIDDETTRP